MTGGAHGLAQGPAIFVGTADEASTEDLDLDGAIAIADRDTRPFAEKLRTVQSAGAAGLIVVNHGQGTFNGTLQMEADIPVVAIGEEHRETLIMAASGTDTLIEIDARDLAPLTGRNVIARWEEGGRCQVLVGGHHDTVAGAVGANDNSSGTAHVIELARAFAADGLDEGLCFATFGAEELGLLGSADLVDAWAKQGILPGYMVNLDVTGTGDDVEVIGDGDLVDRTLEIAEELGIAATASALPANAGSDHTSFEAEGVEVVFFTSGGFPEIHTPNDTLDLIDEAELARVQDLAYAVIAELLDEIAAD